MDQIFSEFNQKSKASLDHLHFEFSKIQTGRANTSLVEDIQVDSYGSKMPLKTIATITIPEARQIAIQPFSKDQLSSVEKAIIDASLGITPQNDGNFIRLNLPILTEERRRDLVKLVNKTAENAHISIRNARHEAFIALKNLEKEKLISEDELKSKEKSLQEKVDEFNKDIDESAKKKDSEIMSI